MVSLKLGFHFRRQMPSKPKPVWCFLVGGKQAFPVNRKVSWIVHDLKKQIKAVNLTKLKGIDAADLTLYHINATEQECIEKFSGMHRETEIKEDKLGSMLSLSQVFKDGVPEMTVHILVVSPQGPKPAGESIYSRACRVVFMAGGVDAIWTHCW
jgi:hypothetical protein